MISWKGLKQILHPFFTAFDLLPGPWWCCCCWGKAGGRRGTCLLTEGRRYHLWGWLQTLRRASAFNYWPFEQKDCLYQPHVFVGKHVLTFLLHLCVCVCVCAHPVYFPVTEGPFVVTNESRRDHYRAWTALCPGNCVLISCQTVAQKPEPLTAVSVSLGASGQGSTMSVKRREATAGWTGRVYGAGRWMKLSKSTVVVLSQ